MPRRRAPRANNPDPGRCGFRIFAGVRQPALNLAALLRVVRTGSEVGVEEGRCSPTRAGAGCACKPSRIRPAASTPATPGCGSSGGTGTARTEAGKSPVTTGLSGRRRSLWLSEKRVNSSSRRGGHATSGLGRGSRPVKTRGNRALCPPDRPQLRGFCLTPEEPHPHRRAGSRGIAAPGSLGSRRDSLPSPGSSHQLSRRIGPPATGRIGRVLVGAARSTTA